MIIRKTASRRQKSKFGTKTVTAIEIDIRKYNENRSVYFRKWRLMMFKLLLLISKGLFNWYKSYILFYLIHSEGPLAFTQTRMRSLVSIKNSIINNLTWYNFEYDWLQIIHQIIMVILHNEDKFSTKSNISTNNNIIVFQSESL